MLSTRFLKQPDRNTIEAAPTRRSKLFTRRAAVRCPQVVPTQPSSDVTIETVAPEATMVLALTEAATTSFSIRASVDDLIIATAEPSVDAPDDAASIPASVYNEIVTVTEPNPVASDVVAAPESVQPLPPTKVKKRGEKRNKSVPGAARRKRSSRTKCGTKESDAGAVALTV
jgi:hypothetical protein